jgi:hypothetical protein
LFGEATNNNKWALAQQNNQPFENPIKAQTLHWVTSVTQFLK